MRSKFTKAFLADVSEHRETDSGEKGECPIRECPLCHFMFPNTSGNFPSFMVMPSWWAGEVPCHNCVAKMDKQFK